MQPVRIAMYVALGALAVLGGACRSGPVPAIDAESAACVPPHATILAGANLARVRSSPLYKQLPPAALALLEGVAKADSLLIASDGANYLAISRGDFREAPPGATLLRRGLAAAGSPDWVRAAASPAKAMNPLLPRAEPVAASSAIWVAAAGNARLPLSGNGENVTRLLRATEYATLSVQLTDRVALEIVGFCRGPQEAQHLEETLRALITLAAAGTAKQPALSTLLRRVRVSSEDRAVHVALEAQAAELEPLFKLF